MVTTGSPTSKPGTKTTEVVDVVTGETCADLADFPLQISSAVGGNLHGTPVVCGGGGPNGYSQKCYKITNSGWQEFATMKEKRYIAAGVVHKNKLHVSGAAGAGVLLQSTEIISIDGDVEYGPELPQAVLRHAITSINSSFSIMSGGQTSAGNLSPTLAVWTPKTFFPLLTRPQGCQGCQKITFFFSTNESVFLLR